MVKGVGQASALLLLKGAPSRNLPHPCERTYRAKPTHGFQSFQKTPASEAARWEHTVRIQRHFFTLGDSGLTVSYPGGQTEFPFCAPAGHTDPGHLKDLL